MTNFAESNGRQFDGYSGYMPPLGLEFGRLPLMLWPESLSGGIASVRTSVRFTPGTLASIGKLLACTTCHGQGRKRTRASQK